MRALAWECGAADTPRFSATISSEGGRPFALNCQTAQGHMCLSKSHQQIENGYSVSMFIAHMRFPEV